MFTNMEDDYKFMFLVFNEDLLWTVVINLPIFSFSICMYVYMCGMYVHIYVYSPICQHGHPCAECPGTHCVDKACVKLRYSPASASLVLGSKLFRTILGEVGSPLKLRAFPYCSLLLR